MYEVEGCICSNLPGIYIYLHFRRYEGVGSGDVESYDGGTSAGCERSRHNDERHEALTPRTEGQYLNPMI